MPPQTTPHHFENFVGHYVRIIKTDGFARYGILVEIKKNYAYLRYWDGKQEAISSSLISTIADAPTPKYLQEDESAEHRHSHQVPSAQYPKATRDLFILLGFFLVVGGAASMFWATTLLALTYSLSMVITISAISALGLALAGVGLYLIIRA